MPVLEVLKSTLRTRDYIENGDREGRSLFDAMEDGALDGMQHFDREIERLARDGVVAMATGLLNVTSSGTLRVALADVPSEDLDSLIVR